MKLDYNEKSNLEYNLSKSVGARMTSTFYGYSGFYGEHCLRSSLEYIYAKYLDYMEIGWTYEDKTYLLSNEVRYKPDFLLENGEYVEIKGVFNYQSDLPKIQRFESEYNVKVTIFQEKDLRQLIKDTPFVFEHLKQEWKSHAKVRGMDNFGKRNPMYGVTQSETTKAKIKAKAKARFADPSFKEKFVNSAKRKAYHESRKGKKTGALVPRFILTCEFCQNSFEVIQHKVSKRRFCSKNCSVQAQHGKTSTTNSDIQTLAHAFALDNYETLLSVKLNNLKELFQALQDSIQKENNILDIRTICQIVTGKPCSRKELLYYLREYAQKVRGATAKNKAVELEDKKPLG
ncbi:MULTISPECIES: NUMOD3 domain-containing DNA-binding protein [unclassified Microcoleus]|uniref:NUMOD3 domain-containing DNA-binding protein n=1 Tax=unclassified Microcoleus TaxID=2642155 RepID=UPI002FD29A6C